MKTKGAEAKGDELKLLSKVMVFERKQIEVIDSEASYRMCRSSITRCEVSFGDGK